MSQNLTLLQKKPILWHKSQFCYTRFNSVKVNSIIFHKFHFVYTICLTKVHSLSQNSILSHKSPFCSTKFNSVLQKCTARTKQKSIIQYWTTCISNIDRLFTYLTGSAEFCFFTIESFVDRKQNCQTLKTFVLAKSHLWNGFCLQKGIHALSNKVELFVEKKLLLLSEMTLVYRN